MSITLESRACPVCNAENSIHINECHDCGAMLPWAGSDATQIAIAPAPEEVAVPKLRKPGKALLGLYFAGVILFCVGALVLFTQVCGILPALMGQGYNGGIYIMALGGALWKIADNRILGI